MPECAWASKYGVTGLNAYWPDSAATYWSTVYPVTEDLEITISGVFPDARYASFTVYDDKPTWFSRNGANSSLPDHLIAPDPGSANPWQGVRRPGGRFTITLSPDVAQGQPNRLPLSREDALPGAKASVIYRVYLPSGGDSTVVLPTVTLTQGGVSKTLPTCPPAPPPTPSPTAPPPSPTASPSPPSPTTSPLPTTTPPATPAAAPAAAPAEDGPAGQPAEDGPAGLGDADRRPSPPPITGDKLFTRTSEVENLAPNPDNAYLGTWLVPPGPDHVVVIRGRAPEAVNGNRPVSWPRRRAEVRYWSMCTNLGGQYKPVVINRFADGSTSYGCRYNDETRIDRHGNYAFVLGTEGQRAAIEEVRNTTFVPFSVSYPTVPHMVLLRHLLPVEDFPYAVQNVPMNSSAETAASIMGAYYPLVTICSLATLTTEGPHGCSA
ncbi:hypothetical protein [Micromonospora sp. WMMD712]|uniref:hypothetical protein n=1 Tax=Micromonospora sp. WMMD712 TaxID=3016096 RepID=UPI00249BA0B2|nr:hypothetical protein [Micromonospora sp. WMMD712]WFE61378.1 hypothetical protein O7633_32985 [Micromonospora sp. WMMD712]